MRVSLKNLLIITLAGLWLATCDAPRNNPLDPGNPESPYAVLEGSVETFKIPHEDLPGVAVKWENSGMSVITDARGHFKFETITPDDGWLFFEKNGYHRDSVLIEWEQSKNHSIEHFLNALPALDSLAVYSMVINTYLTPDKEYQVAVFACVSDPDNDIDSVFWKVPTLGLAGALNFTPDFYETSFKTAQLDLGNEEIVGHDFIITVQDVFDKRVEVGRKSVRRVIKDEIANASPLGFDTVSTLPTLVWRPFHPGFPHTYLAEVYQQFDFSEPELAWSKDNIPEDQSSYQVDSELSPGEYYWVIWAIDPYQNRARSLPTTFVVPEP